MIRSITDPERFRVQYRGGRRYVDREPADGTWEPTGAADGPARGRCGMSLESVIAAEVRAAVETAITAALAAPQMIVPAAYTVPEAARVLGTHPQTLRHSITLGTVPSFDVGGNRGTRIPGWWVHGLPAPSTDLRLVSTTDPPDEQAA